MIYSHISDRYAPFYTKAIAPTRAMPPHVLDGLLNHGTSIKIDEHYTDTGGVTEQVFALCYLLGFRFAPRIRDLLDRRLFTFRPLKQYGILKELAGGVADAELSERNWDELMRLVESIRLGKVSASLAVSKLAAYPRHNEVARALRELGRIERTVYTLDWLQQPELRRRVQARLNKGELRNSLARALRFYRRGGVADRDREEQQRKASGLSLVIGAVSLWNMVYLQKAVAAMTKAGVAVPETVLPHISPLGWEHITLTGIYRFRRFTSDFDTLRALRPFRGQPRPVAPAQAG